MDEGIAVAINGEIFRDGWNQPVPADASIFVAPNSRWLITGHDLAIHVDWAGLMCGA